MIRVTPDIEIPEEHIRLDYVHASGPGGQNVNKVATAAQLRFDVAGCPTLSQDVKERLIALAGRRVTRSGVLLIDARRHRSQEKNRKDALRRLTEMIHLAACPPKTRRKTRPTAASRRRRLDAKRRRGQTKQLRRRVDASDA